jgi:hypothetical protein
MEQLSIIACDQTMKRRRSGHPVLTVIVRTEYITLVVVFCFFPFVPDQYSLQGQLVAAAGLKLWMRIVS